jgi:hypothetical protein
MKSRFAIALALMTVLAGCITPQYVHRRYEPQFLPEAVDSATPVACRVVLRQDDPLIAAKVVHADVLTYWHDPYANGIDLIGRLMDVSLNKAEEAGHEMANKSRQEKAVVMGAPLAGHGLGASFRKDFQTSLSGAVNTSSWLHPLPTGITPFEMAHENKPVTVGEVDQHPVAQINLIYHLSYDAAALIVQAHLEYLRQGQTNATYARYYTYFSEPVGPEHEEAAVAKWVASDQDLLRQRMNEGISEVVEMLERDFFHPGLTDPTNPSVKVSCYDALNLSHVKWEGHIIRKGSPRILFQEKTGNYFSIVPDAVQPDPQ